MRYLSSQEQPRFGSMPSSSARQFTKLATLSSIIPILCWGRRSPGTKKRIRVTLSLNNIQYAVNNIDFRAVSAYCSMCRSLKPWVNAEDTSANVFNTLLTTSINVLCTYVYTLLYIAIFCLLAGYVTSANSSTTACSSQITTRLFSSISG